MPTAYGAEFRQDVIDVARKGEAPLAQIAKDFGLSVTTLKRWIAIAERKESGAGPPPVIALLAESQYPAGHRHGNTIGGKIRDQRVDHFGLMSLAR